MQRDAVLDGGLMLTPCPSCQTPIVTANSQALVPIELQLPPRGWDHRKLGGFVIDRDVATFTMTVKPGDTMYVPHRPLCRKAEVA